jgi:DNA-binding NarL/FixJ family response regulator
MIVDDHPIFRDGLSALISIYDDFDLVAEADDGARAVEQYRRHRPDVTLMDLGLPVQNGAVATQAIRSEFPEARIIVLTTFDGDGDIHRALEAGARGYLLKDSVRTQVADAIGRTESTVKVHVLHVLSKLGVDDRTGAVTVALKRGLIHLT